MIWRARTLPTPGMDSSTAETFILPITSSLCALLEDLGEGALGPCFSRFFTSARSCALGGLLQRGGTLFGGEGRQSHSSHLGFPRKRWVGKGN